MQLIIMTSDKPFVSGDGKRLIEQYLPKDITISQSPTNKPLLSSGYVSVSHTENRAVIAFSSVPVGIDMERNRGLSSRLIKRLGLKEKVIEHWVLREAAIKLYDDPSYLFKDSVGTYSKILYEGEYVIGILSTQPIEIEEIIYA